VKESKVPVGIRTNSREQEVVAKVNHFGFWSRLTVEIVLPTVCKYIWQMFHNINGWKYFLILWWVRFVLLAYDVQLGFSWQYCLA
jgi:hypothetical protein